MFSAMRLSVGSVELAYAAQATLAVVLAISLVWLWRSRAAYGVKAAARPLACLLAPPHMRGYDMVALAVAIAFSARHGLANGFRSYEISLLALVCIAPLAARPIANAIGLPLGLLAMLAFYAVVMSRARIETAEIAAVRPARG